MPDYDIQSNRRRVEAIDLQPYGNTISVETPSDNPFEDAQDIEVFTQTQTGFGGPAPSFMRSRRIITNPQHVSPMWAGRAAAVKMRAPAHRAHTGFAPGINGLGLGETPGGATTTPSQQPGFDWSAVIKAGGDAAAAAGQAYQANQAARQAKYDAAAAADRARQADADARRQALMAPVTAMTEHKGISGGMLAIAAVAGVIGLVMYLKKK